MIDLHAPGAYCRVPGGNLEDGATLSKYVRWLAWSINPDNGGNGDPKVWDLCWRRWEAAGIAHFPWLHCHSLEDVDRLVSVGKRYASPAIGANLEDVVTDFASKGHSLEDVAKHLGPWPGPVHMATLAWVQNSQDWSQLKRVVAALEIFPRDSNAAKDVEGCVAHAFAEGLVDVTLLYGTYGKHVPSDYDLDLCHSLYAADDVGSTDAEWKPWSSGASPCEKLVPMPPPENWYDRPYMTGPPVGPDKLPRALRPPANGGNFVGDDVLAFKRAISRAGRFEPWTPATWSRGYGDPFALGKGTGNVGDSGVRGFQRQEWPNDATMQTGNIGDKTYQAIRRARVSDPDSVHHGEPLLDFPAIRLLEKASGEYQQDEKVAAFRAAVANYCARAEAASSLAWTYDMSRPFGGFGVEPEKYHRADCSAYAILAYFWGRTRSGLAVPDPSDFNYTGFGSTRELDDNERVTSGSYLVGDLALYSTPGHVTICKRPGDAHESRWSSFGSEPRPVERSLYYRGDFLKVVRPPLK